MHVNSRFRPFCQASLHSWEVCFGTDVKGYGNDLHLGIPDSAQKKETSCQVHFDNRCQPTCPPTSKLGVARINEACGKNKKQPPIFGSETSQRSLELGGQGACGEDSRARADVFLFFLQKPVLFGKVNPMLKLVGLHERYIIV